MPRTAAAGAPESGEQPHGVRNSTRAAREGQPSFAALVALIRGDAVPGNAIALALVGMVVAALAWRRAWAILDRADEVANASPATAPSRMTEKYVEPLVLG